MARPTPPSGEAQAAAIQAAIELVRSVRRPPNETLGQTAALVGSVAATILAALQAGPPRLPDESRR